MSIQDTTLGKLQLFGAKLEAQQVAGPYNNKSVGITIGKKFAKVTIGSSVRYFVEIATGIIYASASWQKYNPNRSFGTLDTVDQFDWSGYEGKAFPTSDYEMIVTSDPYYTARLK